MEKTPALLFDAKMPTVFWALGMFAATYLINSLPTRALDGKTPYEMWYRVKPKYKYLKVFGCVANSLVPYERSKKLEPKSKHMITVGFSDTGYVLLDMEMNEISYHSHVTFDESLRYGDLVELVVVNDVNDISDGESEVVLLTEPANDLTYEEAISGDEGEYWQGAIREELDNLEKMNMFEIVTRPVGKKPSWKITTKKKILQPTSLPR